jgi:hypothetical protein
MTCNVTHLSSTRTTSGAILDEAVANYVTGRALDPDRLTLRPTRWRCSARSTDCAKRKAIAEKALESTQLDLLRRAG